MPGRRERPPQARRCNDAARSRVVSLGTRSLHRPRGHRGVDRAASPPDVSGGVLIELGYRWADAGVRRRRVWSGTGAAVAMTMLALVAGSGLLPGETVGGGGLGAAIGRVGDRLVEIPTAGSFMREFSEAMSEGAGGEVPLDRDARADDPVLGIVATAPWRSV